jgi:hypothetical protein
MWALIKVKNLTAHISVLPVISNKKNRKFIANEAHQKIYNAISTI